MSAENCFACTAGDALHPRRQRTPRFRPIRTSRPRRGAVAADCSTKLRAERGRLKSCKDDEIIAQAQRDTSAGLGKRHKMIPSLFSNLVWRAGRAKPDWKKERLGGGRDGALRRPRRVQRRNVGRGRNSSRVRSARWTRAGTSQRRLSQKVCR